MSISKRPPQRKKLGEVCVCVCGRESKREVKGKRAHKDIQTAFFVLLCWAVDKVYLFKSARCRDCSLL